MADGASLLMTEPSLISKYLSCPTPASYIANGTPTALDSDGGRAGRRNALGRDDRLNLQPLWSQEPLRGLVLAIKSDPHLSRTERTAATPGALSAKRSCAKPNLAEFLNMRKVLAALTVVLAFCSGQPAKAGVGFGIPLPFPFLVWTPSSHCGQGSHGSCRPQNQDHSGAIPKAATTHARPSGATKATT